MISNLRRHVLFCGYTLALGATHWDSLMALVQLSTNDSTASHHLLIPLVTLTLLFQGRASVFAVVRSSWLAGGTVTLVGLTAWWVVSGQSAISPRDELTVGIAGFVVFWYAGYLVFYGLDSFRAGLFPLLFLAFVVPMPDALLDTTTRLLKTGSTEAVAWLFRLTGTPHLREAFVFFLPTVAIEIADECSGIRSSIALFLTSLLAGHLFLETGWRRTVLVAAIFPLAILKNAIRIVSLSLLAVYVDPSYLTGQLHHEGGVVFFLIALAFLAPLLFLLRTLEINAVRVRPTLG